MMACRAAMVAGVLSFIIPAIAEESNPIDDKLEKCLADENKLSTADQLICLSEAYDGWDKRLNTVYRALMQTLDPQSRAMLQAAQRSWLEYRKKDAEFANGPWRANSGTLAQITITSDRLEGLRIRVHALETYARGD